MEPPEEQRPAELVLTDPRAMRALAHQVRQQVLDLFDDHEAMTATEAANAVGITPSAMSYHLRALEKWGIVTRAEQATDGRERPWRMAARSIRFSSGTEAGSRAGRAMMTAVLSRIEAALDRAREPGGGNHYVANATAPLTDEELTQVYEAFEAALAPYKDRTANGQDTPEGATRRSIFFLGISED